MPGLIFIFPSNFHAASLPRRWRFTLRFCLTLLSITCIAICLDDSDIPVFLDYWLPDYCPWGLLCSRQARYLHLNLPTRQGLAINFNLSSPVVNSLKGITIRQIKHNHHRITILIVKRKQWSKSFLTSSIPKIHLDHFPLRIHCFKSMKAGTKCIGHLILELTAQ